MRYQPKPRSQLKIQVASKVDVLFGRSIKELTEQTLTELGITHGLLEIDDDGALPFVLQARIEAAIKKAYPDLEAASLPQIQSHARYPGSRERFRRSRIYVPGAQPKLMLNVGLHQPDGVILDLEDSVAPAEKSSARLIVRNALRTLDFFGAEKMVRINQGERGIADLEAIIPQPVHLVLIPKVETAYQVRLVAEKIAEIAAASGRHEPVYLMPIIESALGVLNALSIAQGSENNVALAIGLEDYTADLGVQRTSEGSESFFARSMLVNAARASGLQAMATVFSDVQDMEGLRAAALEAKALGFDGMGAIHPRQIAVINGAFAPAAEEIEQAQRVVLAYDEAQAKGLGVVALGSKMIDPPVVKRAQQTVDLAL
ncbi:MAG: citrate lyase ACP, partial [Candidatus Marinimicrobia bacterium]|nr:citrate lyase ACP [Candidatus Neomarinimicrobiota bacterium]